MRTVQGDLIALAKEGTFDVIVHGCNCFCRMGRGIAPQIARAFPEAEAADRATTPGDRSKLGTCSFAAAFSATGVIHVVNAYTQFHWNGDGTEVLVDYEAVRSCMASVRENYRGMRIGLPKLGAGLARGDWPTIHAILVEELAGEDVTIVEFAR